MKQTFFARVRQSLEVKLDTDAGTGVLSVAEQEAMSALYAALCATGRAASADYLARLAQRAETQPGLFQQLQAGVRLLEGVSAKRCGRNFAALTEAKQHRVLAQLLSGHRSQASEPYWRRKAKLTRWHFDQVLCTPATRAFRQFVVRDILLDHYRGESGWSLVGYKEYPGRVRIEWEPCEVLRVYMETDHILLELSDGTFDKLQENALSAPDADALIATTKSGRQRASFSRAAYETLVQYLEEDGDDFVIRYASRTWRIAASA